jgi:SET domain
MPSVLKLLLILPLFVIMTVGVGAQSEPWQYCETFLAPSSLPSGGWGVFAGRDFEEGEIVEIAPRFIPMPHDAPAVRRSEIDFYHYGYLRWRDEQKEFETMGTVVFGHVMFYNHHVEPNMRYSSYGREPSPSEPHIAQAVGFVALRKIDAGEELFSTYGIDDGGERWFQDRGLKLVVIPTYASRKNGTVYDEDKKKYCSKVYAGYGQPSWNSRVLASLFADVTFPYKFETQRLAPVDHPVAVVNQDVNAGTVLEISPALVISKALVADTPLASSGFFWHDWDEAQQKDLDDLWESYDLRLQYQDPDYGWIHNDTFIDFGDVVVFPAAGNIALVERVGKSDDANCKIEILASGSMKSHLSHGGASGSAGILLQLVAIKDIKTGVPLKLNIHRGGSPREREMLLEELLKSGQPIPEYLKHKIGPALGSEEL